MGANCRPRIVSAEDEARLSILRASWKASSSAQEARRDPPRTRYLAGGLIGKGRASSMLEGVRWKEAAYDWNKVDAGADPGSPPLGLV